MSLTTLNGANISWMLMSSALVFLMTPGLAFFYGGLVQKKNILNTLMMSFSAIGVVTITWAVIGYSIAYGSYNPFFGGISHIFLNGVNLLPEKHSQLPHLLLMIFEATFAIITSALISGAIVERMSFSSFLIFICLWTITVYSPICHWVWGDGWLKRFHILDFAGGMVVHLNASVAGLVAAIVVKPRKIHKIKHITPTPHNIPFVLLGAGLLWFGWFGFSAGSALAVNGQAIIAFVNTLLAPSASLIMWILMDKIFYNKISVIGGATGVVVGLVAITPAAGFINPSNAMILGAIATIPSYILIKIISNSNLDDTLDLVAIHGVGAISGALLTGIFAQKIWGGTNGLLYGNPGQLLSQLVGILVVIVYCAIISYVLLKIISLITPLRISDSHEESGLDISLHQENAYSDGAQHELKSQNQ